ncbi:hypothetical protein K0C01_12105 [Salinarchaeum sp. IM2453]|uniref:hypothetical protein n=1 Tax=Salinarchaeum sp. IM2453 TaxID=2862870 RepID=UPI001C83A367|nr:hypothetical protein [Salinarchaeum sp. IM2453]QZA88506.1 hypothetical protein K0C01_12105 [Salinarchaeum sp. IM2453]
MSGSDAKAAGMTAAMISVAVTMVVTLLVTPPWSRLTILLGVALAAYFSASAAVAEYKR